MELLTGLRSGNQIIGKIQKKKPVKNKDLWIKLDSSCQKHKVSWKWVKAHAGNKYNNLVDKLAVSQSK